MYSYRLNVSWYFDPRHSAVSRVARVSFRAYLSIFGEEEAYGARISLKDSPCRPLV